MNKKKIIILGGGISGLYSLNLLKERYPNDDITLLEKNTTTGGCIQSYEQDGFLFEFGPHTIRPNSHLFFDLIEDLNLKDQLIEASSNAQKKYLYKNNGLVPFTPKKLLLSFKLTKILHGLINDLTKKRKKTHGQSIKDVILHRFNLYIYETFFDPLISGIFAEDGDKLSFDACFPYFKTCIEKHRSLLIGLFKEKRKRTSLYSFKKGLSTLTNSLYEKNKPHIVLNCPVFDINFSNNQWNLKSEKTLFTCDHIVSTLPATSLSTLIHDNTLSALLDKFTFSPIACIYFGFKKRKVTLPDSFGYLVPQKEKQPILGVIFDSKVFTSQDNPGIEKLTVMVSEKSQKNFFSLSQEDLIKIGKDILVNHLNISIAPDITYCKIIKNAIPKYHLSHPVDLKLLENHLQKGYQNFTLLGNSFYGVSVPNCLESAKKKLTQLVL